MVRAIYFDGRVAADRAVSVVAADRGLTFQGPALEAQHWSYGGLRAVDPYQPGHALRLAHQSQPGARLLIHDDALARDILQRAPALADGFSWRGLGRIAAWTAGALAAVALAAYLFLQLAPQVVARHLPDGWRNRMGMALEASLTKGARACAAPSGVAVLSAMAARLAEGTPSLPPLRIAVYDIPVMNAFAMPGERIVITRELIARARRPEQVAGVLAHEIGHAIERHSEAQLVRATGLQLVLGLVTGGGSDMVGSAIGVTAILTYGRRAEAEADAIALRLLGDAAIDPLGLKEFFEMILAEEGGRQEGGWGRIRSIISTHPGTAERIGRIEPLPDGIVARAVLSDEQWRALRAICG